jgi:hypothetical protein
MVDANTSPVRPYSEGTQTVGARLCNFGSGSSELGGAHKDWITNHFAPKMALNPNGWIDLIGHSSTSGTAVANLAICNKRMDAVEKFIKSKNPNIKVNVKEARGSAEAQSFNISPTNSEGYWRAVMVRWWGVNTPIQVPLYPADTVDWMKRVYKLMPTVEVWRSAAEKVLILAETGVNLPTPSPLQSLAMNLVDRVFKLTSAPGQTTAQTKADLQGMKGVFGQMKLLIQAINKGDMYLHESTDPAHAGDNAYTLPGHWAMKTPSDGIWYTRAKVEPQTDEWVVDCTIHEFAHFCGPLGANAIDHAHVGGKPAYGALALTLNRSDALKNASSYAWLAYLARKPSTQWLTAT